jgi:glycerol-3-phosphate dehydrogenase
VCFVLCRKLGVSTPIIDGIYRVIHEGADARNIVSEVMCRPLTAEVDPSILEAAARPA